jgi:hypothetical protein
MTPFSQSGVHYIENTSSTTYENLVRKFTEVVEISSRALLISLLSHMQKLPIIVIA